MINLITGIAKAAIAVAVTPVTLAADILMLPADSEDINKPAFSRTGNMLKSAMENIEKSVESE
jgi:hypothetical protein